MNTLKSVIVIGLTSIIVQACKHEEEKVSSENNIPVVEATEVVTLQPSKQITLPGELKPWNKVTIYARVKGYIKEVQADRGTTVRKGQSLAVLDAPDLVSELNHAKAQVASAGAALIEQRAKRNASTLTYKRLLETNKTRGAVSATELDLAYARMLADSALTTAAQENLNAAEAQHTSQAQLVNYLTIKAPFDGTIIERNVSPGELVGPEGNAKPLFILEDRSKFRLTVAVPENLSNSITNHSEVSFFVQADPLKEYKAVFARSANSLYENNRTMATEFDFDNRAGALKSGMYAEVALPVTRNKPTLFVPKTSVIQSTEGVFVVRLNTGSAEWLAVQKGTTLDSLVEVFGSLQTGDKVARYAFEELRNGQKVRIK